MRYQVLVSNQSTVAQAEIIDICSIDRVWSANESMQVFLSNGGVFEECRRKFSIIIITCDEGEIDFLNDSLDNDPYIKKWLFVVPEKGTEEFNELYLTGQIERSLVDIIPYLKERS